MSKAFKWALTIITGFIILVVIHINIKLYSKPDLRTSGNHTINIDAIKQLSFLKEALDNHADTEMQKIYPEGYVFMNALYGLTWCSVLEQSGNDKSNLSIGLAEIQKAFNKIDSQTGRAPFDESLPIPYGAFYTGWSSYLLGKKLSLERHDLRDSAEVQNFKENCKEIAIIIQNQTYPASYYGGVWPADGIMCVASLSLHDKLFPSLYQNIISRWISSVNQNLDVNGLIPHSINSTNSKIQENARGSSQSLLLIFLSEIDKEFATQQFTTYKEKFVDTRLGLTGIREYPIDYHGSGDVDSGPVIFQMGGAATIVGMQTLKVYGEYRASNEIRSVVEAFGLPVNNANQKFYLFGLLPMADTFIVWSKRNENITNQTVSIFTTFHLYSFGMIVLLGLLIWYLWK